jgi:peptidoglycan/xylan/chitin deacetylase (PgdA/CDA1 family)
MAIPRNAAQKIGYRLTLLDHAGNILFMSRLGDLGMSYRHGPRAVRRVALTFDDGPVAGGTEEILATLAEYDAPGTFFCIGANVLQHPELVRQSHALGHVIGAHSMHHSRKSTLSLFDGAHIEECVHVIHDALGKTPALFRAPWGWMTPWETLRLRRRGLAPIRWDIETPDSLFPCPSGEEIAAWTLPRVRPGSMLVFHDGIHHTHYHPKPQTAQALRIILPELRSQGFEFVTAPTLLNIPAYQEENAPRDQGDVPIAFFEAS